MILILSEMVVASEADALKFCAAVRECIEQTRLEKGCVQYDYARDVVDSLVIRVIERWKDKAAIRSHMETPHLQALMKSLGEIEMESSKLKVYDIANERDYDPREFE